MGRARTLQEAAGGKVSSQHLTQVGRALAQLGIEHIAAYSPEARGRSERLFRTLQDRLPKELRLVGAATLDAANRHLAETYIAEHNARFAVPAEQAGTAFVPDSKGAARNILAIQEERYVGNDNTVKWRRLSLQLPPSRLRPHFVRAKVRVHEYPDATIAVFLGPHRLADYDQNGRLLEPRSRGRVTRFHNGRFGPGHAPAQSQNEAVNSPATKTGQLDASPTPTHDANERV